MLDYRHLTNMTDETGMLQFSKLSAPDPRSGYTLDDNARALMIALFMNNGEEHALKYAEFLYKAQRPDGSWSNFLFDNQYFSHFDSEDSVGRALLACSLGSLSKWNSVRKICTEMFKRNIPRVLTFNSLRGTAYGLLALCKSKLPESDNKNLKINMLINHLSERLLNSYQTSHVNKWMWFEDRLTYCNGILPQALLAAYAVNGDKKCLKIGHDSLSFLTNILFKKGYLNIVGNHGWYKKGEVLPLFDQQPVDAASIVYACLEAYEVVGSTEYLELAVLAHKWYRGLNVHGISLYDKKTGGCYDGLTPEGVNLNQGAEAVLSLLFSDTLMKGIIEQKTAIEKTS